MTSLLAHQNPFEGQRRQSHRFRRTENTDQPSSGVCCAEGGIHTDLEKCDPAVGA